MADDKKGTGPKHTPATRATPGKDAKSEAPKRRMLTDEERIAKLEADLKAAREKKEAKVKAQVDDLKGKRQILVQQIKERQAKVRDLDTQLSELGVDTGAPVVEGSRPVAAAEGASPSTTTSRVKD